MTFFTGAVKVPQIYCANKQTSWWDHHGEEKKTQQTASKTQGGPLLAACGITLPCASESGQRLSECKYREYYIDQ